jgi:hypothetical protein
MADVNGTQDWANETDLTPSKSSGVEDGYTGSGVMSVWEASRQTKIDRLASRTYTNNSSFSIPLAVVDTQDWANSWSNDEQLAGIFADGTILKPDGTPLSGTVQVIEGEDTLLAQKETTGSFVVSSNPPTAVSQGGDATTSTITIQFIPSISAVAVVEENVSYRESLGTIKYGSVTGQITDYNGDPVPNATLRGAGAGDVTDENGEFELLVPDGTTSTFVTLNGTYEFDRTISEGTTERLDIQYPQLTIEVLDADYEPVEEVPVVVDESVFYTGGDGRVEIPKTPLGTYNVEVMETYAADLSVDTAGEEFVHTIGPGPTPTDWTPDPEGLGGVKLTVTDAETGRKIRGIRAVDKLSGAASKSNAFGVCKLLTTDVGEEAKIQIGLGDERYVATTVTGTPPANEMVEVSVDLTPKTQVVNF